MRLPIVDNAERPVELDWLRINGVMAPPNVRARLEVRRDVRERRGQLHASRLPEAASAPVDLGELDAMLAGELVAAVRVLVESGAPSDDVTDEVGGVNHEVEVSWGGVVHRYVVSGEPVDDALGGVLQVAARLLDAEPRITSVEPD